MYNLCYIEISLLSGLTAKFTYNKINNYNKQLDTKQNYNNNYCYYDKASEDITIMSWFMEDYVS